MNVENQNTIDRMTKEVLTDIRYELGMIKELGNSLTFSFGNDSGKTANQTLIEGYEHKLERNLKVLKVLKG